MNSTSILESTPPMNRNGQATELVPAPLREDQRGPGPVPPASRGEHRAVPWAHRLAMVLTALTFVLIAAGANVTSKNVGLAVPDWPLSFQSVNPEGWISNMDGTRPGVRDEHGHRLLGATVGLVVIGLVIVLQAREPRAAVRRWGWVALAAVIAQGVMGGLRVTEKSQAWAIFHGCFAQAFLCLTIALAMVTSPRWASAGSLAGADRGRNRALRIWTAALALAVYGQLVLGALLRHTGSSAAAVLHIGGALAVGVAVIQAAQHVFARPESEAHLARPMIGIFLLFGLQLLLGVASYVLVLSMTGPDPSTLLQAYVPTVHVVLGAVILGVSFMMAFRALALTCPASRCNKEIPTP